MSCVEPDEVDFFRRWPFCAIHDAGGGSNRRSSRRAEQGDGSEGVFDYYATVNASFVGANGMLAAFGGARANGKLAAGSDGVRESSTGNPSEFAAEGLP